MIRILQSLEFFINECFLIGKKKVVFTVFEKLRCVNTFLFFAHGRVSK